MKTILQIMAVTFTLFVATPLFGQSSRFYYPQNEVENRIANTSKSNFSILEYHRMFARGVTPTPEELHGTWRGVNKGIVTLAGFKQFVKQIEPRGCMTIGTNVQTHQVSNGLLRLIGWQPKRDTTGRIETRGNFKVLPNQNAKRRGRGVEFSYRDGGNPENDASRLLVDRVVKIDNCYMIGRASVQLGPIRLPIAYFTLERIDPIR